VFDWGKAIVVLAFLGCMTAVNIRGIRESMWTNLLCTAVEVGGLLFIIAISMRFWGSVDYLETPHDHAGAWTFMRSLFAGSVLTFFAFVGFEDMLNVAEEVKEPERTMPWGMILALLIVAALYMAVSISAVSVVPYAELQTAAAPLAPITERAASW